MRMPVGRWMIAWALVGVLPVTVACKEPGLHRTDFSVWETQELPLLGAQVEVPKDYYYSGGDSSIWVTYLMHPVFPPRSSFDEPRFALEIRIYRWAMEEINDRRSSVTIKDVTEEQRKFWKWVYDPHETIDLFETAGQVVFRKDTACPDGSTLVAHATLSKVEYSEGSDQTAEDRTAIERILSSVECTAQTTR